MDDELTPEEKFAAEDPETLVPRAILAGRHPEDIVAELVRLDWKPHAAWAVVRRAADDLRRYQESPESRHRLVREARAQFVLGVILFGLAATLTGLAFLVGVCGGALVVVVATGPLGAGGLMMTRGWARWRLYRRPTLPFALTPAEPGEAGDETT